MIDVKDMCPVNADKYTVLVVDDEEVNRVLIKAYLSICGYHIILATDGHEALEKLAQNPQINLLILDVMMPKLSGFSVCQEIRKTRGINELPIIFLTADGNSDSMVNAFYHGGNEYLIKPVHKWELLLRVKNLVSITGKTLVV